MMSVVAIFHHLTWRGNGKLNELDTLVEARLQHFVYWVDSLLFAGSGH